MAKEWGICGAQASCRFMGFVACRERCLEVRDVLRDSSRVGFVSTIQPICMPVVNTDAEREWLKGRTKKGIG